MKASTMINEVLSGITGKVVVGIVHLGESDGVLPSRPIVPIPALQ